MRTSTKHLGNSNKLSKKFVELAFNLYPDMEWAAMLPDPEITDNYGKGVLLEGRKGVVSQVYFILADDPRKENWIHMIASQVQEKIDGSTGN